MNIVLATVRACVFGTVGTVVDRRSSAITEAGKARSLNNNWVVCTGDDTTKHSGP